jgi:hypothetical protein
MEPGPVECSSRLIRHLLPDHADSPDSIAALFCKRFALSNLRGNDRHWGIDESA